MYGVKLMIILCTLLSISQAGLIGLAVGFVPFAGPVVEMGCGFYTGSPTTVLIGAGGLALDIVTMGTSRAATNTARAVRAGKKGKSLVKAARTARKAKRVEKALDNLNNARNAINTARKANWGLC